MTDAPARPALPPVPAPLAPGTPSPLVPLLTLERIEEDHFRGPASPGGKGRVFGGQVVAQALQAATLTVDDGRAAHSLHAYFMRPGDATQPVLYQVERDRDGRSFDTRRVIAIQKGRPILNLAASFHAPEPGLEHQAQMPDAPAPEDLPNDWELAHAHADALPAHFLRMIRWDRPIEIRPAMARPPYPTDDPRPVNKFWFRARGDLGADPRMHRAALAYASDMGLLLCSLAGHARAFGAPDIMGASLDHALWIHDDFRADDWLLYSMESPWAGGARSFNLGAFHDRQGRLVASAAQEGLIRVIRPRG